MNCGSSLNAIGTVTEVHGPVAVIRCHPLPPLHQALQGMQDGAPCLFEVHQHLDDQRVRAITLHGSTGLHRGMRVHDTGGPLGVPVSPECLGRLLPAQGAIRHLDQRSSELIRQSQALAQEEIIEEIEVMLLSAGDAMRDLSTRSARRIE